jgi:hypothetical protein
MMVIKVVSITLFKYDNKMVITLVLEKLFYKRRYTLRSIKSLNRLSYAVITGAVIGSIIFLVLARNLALYFKLRGLVLNLYPQHGHHKPSHLINISHI